MHFLPIQGIIYKQEKYMLFLLKCKLKAHIIFENVKKIGHLSILSTENKKSVNT
jgi:hypothetical protein